MDPNTYTYDICQRYVLDHRRELGTVNQNRILGWIRSRSIQNLASCVDYTITFEQSLASSKNIAPDDLLQDQKEAICRIVRQIAAFFKKNKAFVSEESCLDTATTSFEEAEAKCHDTNLGLDTLYIERSLEGTDFDFRVSKAKSYIRRVLGDFDNFLDSVPELGVVTAGATATRSRLNSLPPLKVSLRPRCTRRAFPYLRALAEYYSYPVLRERCMEWNRVEFVPKNWKTHRTIACEPEGNMPLQLAFDRYVKRRLKKFGISLKDQSCNQELARIGSVDGSLATIDLAQASDTLSINTVAWLLPLDWYKYLSDVRCQFGKVGTKLFKYSKFSSMGNGSTFALESLIFASLCYATGSKSFSVFGDDLIIETELVDDLVELLQVFGFSVNAEKSYTSGPFRESCGTDWYRGVDVTPFYLRNVDKRKAVTCHNVNGLLRISYPGGLVWDSLLQTIKDENLPLVPWNENTMSGVFITPHTAYSLNLLRADRKGHKWVPQFKAYTRQTETVVIDDSRALFLWHFLKRVPLNIDHLRVNDEGTHTEFGETSRYTRARKVYVRRWCSWFIPTAVTPLYIYLLEDLIGLQEDAD